MKREAVMFQTWNIDYQLIAVVRYLFDVVWKYMAWLVPYISEPLLFFYHNRHLVIPTFQSKVDLQFISSKLRAVKQTGELGIWWCCRSWHITPSPPFSQSNEVFSSPNCIWWESAWWHISARVTESSEHHGIRVFLR